MATYYNPPVNQFYTQIPVTIEKSNIGLLIGKNGCIFKSITTESNVKYIWYDSNRNVIEIWGPHSNLSIAILKLQNQIKYVQDVIKNNMKNMYEKEFPPIRKN